MEIHLKNYMEDVVMQNLVSVMTQTGACTCEVCQMDITAIALNNLKPYYVVTKEGGIYARTAELATQFHADVVSAIIKGIEIVKARPRHD